MKTKFYILAVLAFTIQAVVKGQIPASQASTYNEAFWIGYTQKLQLTDAERTEFLTAKKTEALKQTRSILNPVTPLPAQSS